MKLKTRLLAPLFALLMLGTATSAFADIRCDISAILNTTPAPTPGPVPRGVVNGHWENTGDLQFDCFATNGTPTTEASITIFYGLTIVNTPTLPAAAGRGHNINVVNVAGGYGVILDTTRTDTGPTGVSNGGLIGLTLPAQGAPANGRFVLQNVLLSLNGGTTVGSAVSANINVVSQSGNVALTGTPVVIISNVLPELNSTTLPPVLGPPIAGEAAAAAQFTSTGGIPPSTVACSTANCRNARAAFLVAVSEDHNDSWRSTANYYNNGNGVTINGTNVLFTFSGMLPGSIISNCILTPSAGTWTLTGSGIASTAGTTTLVAELQVTPLASLGTLDTLYLRCGVDINNPAYLVGGSTGAASTPITVSMSTFPVGTALVNVAGILSPSETGGTPRFNATGGSVGPVTVIQFGATGAGTTTMLIPYALANVGTYDTGIAIANTTKDGVFGTDLQGAAPDTSGNLTFYFYPGDGAATFSIAPTTGFNLANGVVPPGNSFIGTLSSILRAGNSTAPFQGYVIIQANFTHAHGTAYVYGGTSIDRLTSQTDVLTLNNPLAIGRNAVVGGGGFEPTGR